MYDLPVPIINTKIMTNIDKNIKKTIALKVTSSQIREKTLNELSAILLDTNVN